MTINGCRARLRSSFRTHRPSFYGERYDIALPPGFRGRTLSSTTALDPFSMHSSSASTGSGVDRIASLSKDALCAGYRFARAAGSSAMIVPPGLREMIRTRSAERGGRADDLDLCRKLRLVRRACILVPALCRSDGRVLAWASAGRRAGSLPILEILRTVSSTCRRLEDSLPSEQQSAPPSLTSEEFNNHRNPSRRLLAVDLDGRVTRCNPRSNQMLGVKRDASIGLQFEDLVAEDFRRLCDICGPVACI